jgi:acyl dehydratase
MAGTEAPSLVRSYIRALLPRRGGGSSPWPVPEAVQEGVRIDADHLRCYRRLCGFADETSLPPTYPHLTAFPMTMALMTGRGFPFRVLGVVHIRNAITQLRPIHWAEPLDFRVWVEEPCEHPGGTAFDVGAQVRDTAGELVWTSASTYLRRGKRPTGADRRAQAPPAPPVPARATTWSLPADLGRRYAAVTGDRNPIHLYPWTARLFGFKRQIAHGMWSAARCLAAIDAAPGAEADAFPASGLDFAVEFRAPVLLPSTVAFATAADAEGGTAFTLTSAHSGRTHLVGRLNGSGECARPSRRGDAGS